MKRTLLLVFSLIFILQDSYTQAKRYIFLEHFTNTRCGICTGANPGFYSLLTGYKNQYHHMSVHPPIPYSACLLYQANPSDNSQRSNFYNIVGTPTLMINGQIKKSLGSVTASTLNAELNKLSPIEVLVKESGTNQRNANVEIKTVGIKPGGNYKLYAVALEKELNYASPNGEKIHHNVFRDFLSAADGDPIDLAGTGSSIIKTFSITIPSTWVENQVYILAWIQDAASKEVLNSGTIFAGVTANEDLQSLQFSVYPNPVQDLLKLEWPNTIPSTAKLSQPFANFFNAYTKAMNKRYRMVSSLFEDRFERVPLKDDNHFTHVIPYVHSNPQKHKIVEDFRTYQFTSYPSFLNGDCARLEYDDVINWYGGKEKFVERHDQVFKELRATAEIRSFQNLSGQEIRGFQNLGFLEEPEGC